MTTFAPITSEELRAAGFALSPVPSWENDDHLVCHASRAKTLEPWVVLRAGVWSHFPVDATDRLRTNLRATLSDWRGVLHNDLRRVPLYHASLAPKPLKIGRKTFALERISVALLGKHLPRDAWERIFNWRDAQRMCEIWAAHRSSRA